MSPEYVRRPPLSRSLRRSMLMAALLLLAAGPARAQNTTGASDSSGYSVRGSVVNSITGQSVAHALVTLSGDQATLTDGDGQFSFDNVTAGQYMVSVSKPGFLGFGNTGGSRGPHMMNRANLGQNTPPHRLQVGPNQPSVTLRIAPAGTIAGQVTLSTSDPADGIHITLYRRQMHNGHPLWEVAGETQSRSDGSFRLGGLPPGSYMLSTHASLDSPDPSTNSRLPVWGYPPVYSPGVTDPGSAGILNLAAGQLAEADISITRQQFFPVLAAVRSSEGQSPANFEVLDSGGHSTGLPAHYDNREQLLHASVPNGSWILEGRAFGRNLSWGRAEFLVASAPVALAINVLQIPRIPVNIQREFTASNSSPANGPGVNLVLASADPFATGSVSGGMSTISNGTAYAINLAEPGHFWVEAFPSGATYVSSITSGGVDLASNPLIVAPGSTPSPIDVTLRDDVGSITGQLNADSSTASASNPTPGVSAAVSIYAIPLFASAGPIPEGFVHSDGSFSISNIAPGSYRVIACDTPQQIDDHTPEGLAAWATKGQTVTVDPNGTAHATLDVIHAETTP